MAGVKREREGAVGILTLDEAASLNAMTPELFGESLRNLRELSPTYYANVPAGYAALRVIEPAGRPQPLDVTIDGVDLTSSLTLGVEGALGCFRFHFALFIVERVEFFIECVVGWCGGGGSGCAGRWLLWRGWQRVCFRCGVRVFWCFA